MLSFAAYVLVVVSHQSGVAHHHRAISSADNFHGQGLLQLIFGL